MLCQSPIKQTIELSSVHASRQLDIPDGLSSRLTLDGIHTTLECATLFATEFRVGDAGPCRNVQSLKISAPTVHATAPTAPPQARGLVFGEPPLQETNLMPRLAVPCKGKQ